MEDRLASLQRGGPGLLWLSVIAEWNGVCVEHAEPLALAWFPIGPNYQ
jgi:hypothetical protein